MSPAKKKPTRAKSTRKRSSLEQKEAFRRTRKDHAAETREDYAELIQDLLQSQGEARLVDIAKRMGVSHVTAGRTVARLQRDGLVETKPYRAIFLTRQGQKIARESRARHHTVYQFLRAIGVPEAHARIDAEGIEHHISDTTLKAISKFLETGPKR